MGGAAAEPDRGRASPTTRPSPPSTLALEAAADAGVTVRGIYDVSGLRADADLMLWLHGDDPAALQAALRRTCAAPRCCRSSCRRGTRWACTATPSSTAATCPASSAASAPATGSSVYPFVPLLRLVRAATRTSAARMLAEHGRKGAAYTLGRREHGRRVRARRLRVDPADGVRLAHRPRRHDARPARHRGPPARARGDAVLHRSPDRARPRSPRWCADGRRQPRSARRATPRRAGPEHIDRAGRLRRHPARQLRRPGGPGRRHPVPPQRHARPRHPGRAARGGRAPLPRTSAA